MSETVNFTINGIKRSVEISQGKMLLDYIRSDLGLTGSKKGCGYGQCGTCTVVMDGVAVKACIIPIKKAEKTTILTIEGISDGFTLHPLQQAFIDAGAVQCGFCTPGIIMTLYALFNQKINASESEIRDALEGHLCRCTGYETILQAALLGQKMMKQ